MADHVWTPRSETDALAVGFAAPATPQQRGAGQGNASSIDEHTLFTTPADLLCPITLTIFRDPVINSAGQVYERHAMEACFASADVDVDPLSRTPLPTRTLTPVHVLRSRALEYRLRTATTCVERACTNGCDSPARYVRRACELAGNDLRVKGLSQALLAYVASHPSNAYDTHVLDAFAQSLQQGGYRDKAASVYCNMLQQHGVDRSQQAALLKRCLECWGPSHQEGPPSALVDANTLDKLAVVVQQRGLSWATLLDLAAEAGQGPALPLALCEQVLRRATPPADAGWWVAERDLLMRFVQLSVASMREEVLRVPQLERVLPSAVPVHAQPGGIDDSARQQHGRVRRVLGCLTVGLSVLMGGNPVVRALSGGVGLLLVAPDIGS